MARTSRSRLNRHGRPEILNPPGEHPERIDDPGKAMNRIDGSAYRERIRAMASWFVPPIVVPVFVLAMVVVYAVFRAYA